MKINDKIETEVSRQVGGLQIDTKIENAMLRRLPTLNNDYLLANLPGMVKANTKQCVDSYMPTYINGSSEVKSAMDNHLRDVSTQVETVGREVINKLVREDTYGGVLSAFKGDLKTTNQSNFDGLKQSNETNFNHLKSSLEASKGSFEQKSRDIERLQRENSELRKELDSYKSITIGSLFVGFAGLGFSVFQSLKK